MPKRSHKPSKLSQDKIARAQHRNNFLRTIEQICNLVAGKDIYKLIPSDILEVIYNTRLQSLRVVEFYYIIRKNHKLYLCLLQIIPIYNYDKSRHHK